MAFWQNLCAPFELISIYGAKDILEIFFFSALFFNIFSWLKKDRSSPLLFTFLASCVVVSIASFAHFNAITSFILLYSPAIMMLFIVIHQESLQKQFVTVKRQKAQSEQTTIDWLELIIRACLHARSLGKSFACIIEQRDTLDPFLHSGLHINAPLQQSLLPFIIESSSFDQAKAILISQHGTLCAVNTHLEHNASHDSALAGAHPFFSSAALLTGKTDAIALIVAPDMVGFTAFSHGTIMEQLTAKQAHTFLKQQIMITHVQKEKGELYDFRTDKTSVHEQSHS